MPPRNDRPAAPATAARSGLPQTLTAALTAALATAAAAVAAVRPQDPAAAGAPAMRSFVSRNDSFRIDLPTDWRQLAPAEVAAVQRAVPDLPLDVRRNEPSLFYAVGPVDRWLRGDFDGFYLYVVEQDNEWHLTDDVAARLQELWDRKGEMDGNRYQVLGVERPDRAPEHNPIVLARRRITPPKGKPQCSLDAHAPAGGREFTLCFQCPADEFDGRSPQIRAMIATLEFALPARGSADLGDRLWTPAIAGGLVGLVMIVLYRRTRRAPPPPDLR